MFTLHNGDCLKFMKTLQPASGLCIVTDPPYGFNYDPNRNKKIHHIQKGMKVIDRNWQQIAGEEKEFDPSPFLPFEIVVLWGANHYAHKLPNSKRWLIWDKRDGVASDNQSDAEMAWCNVGGSVRLYRQLWRGIARAGEENIANMGEKLHPHQKPVALMIWTLQQVGITEGMTVFDPYMGSGSTGVACMRLNINFLGCEISPEYFAMAEKRIKQAALQPGLFTPSNNRLHLDVGDSPAQQALFTPEADTAQGALS